MKLRRAALVLALALGAVMPRIAATQGFTQRARERSPVYELGQNYPNPFNPSTIIRFDIALRSDVVLKVYDMLGREIETLVNEKLSAGSYEKEFNSAGRSSGIYIYRLTAENFTSTKKMLLIK